MEGLGEFVYEGKDRHMWLRRVLTLLLQAHINPAAWLQHSRHLGLGRAMGRRILARHYTVICILQTPTTMDFENRKKKVRDKPQSIQRLFRRHGGADVGSSILARGKQTFEQTTMSCWWN